MKIFLIVFSLFIIPFVVFFIIKGIDSRNGTPPKQVEGRLAQCSTKPNCVCSEFKENTKHYIKPIVLESEVTTESLIIFKKIILNMGGSIHSEEKYYLSSQFSSSIFGFVDDLEIRLDKEHNLIHLRSSSRVGTNDFGVNRKRINDLKNRYKKESTKNNL